MEYVLSISDNRVDICKLMEGLVVERSQALLFSRKVFMLYYATDGCTLKGG